MSKKPESYPALSVYKYSWAGFLAVGVFSFFVNLGALASPIYMQQIFDRVMQSQHLETLGYLTLIIFFFLGIIGILDAIRGSILAHISRWWDETVSSDLFKALIESARQRGFSQNSAVSDLMSIRQFVGGPGILPFFDGPWMPLFLLAITLVHPVLGAVAVTAAVLLFIIAFINDRVTRKRMFGIASRQASAQTTVDVATRHADSVHSMGMTNGILARYDDDNTFVRDAMYRVSSASAKLGALSKFIRMVAQISVLGLGAYFSTLGEMTPGGMIAASIIMGRALSPAEQAMGAWRGFLAAREAHGRLRKLFLDSPPPAEATNQPKPKGKVEFRKSSFVMSGQERPLLQNLNITFDPGQIIAIVGPSGSGKSTFCKMLIGAIDPTAGSVRLDGVKIRNYPHKQFASSLGYLAQTVELLDGTVKDNIARMGKSDDELVVAAATLAGCHDLINRLPMGYDTLLGTGGVNLSGGQAQRIGLARALYGDPALLVLDEPNANLDADGDAALQSALTELREKGKTIIVVSHKPTALASVDQVVTINEGTISKVQTREEFLREAIQPVGKAIHDKKNKAANDEASKSTDAKSSKLANLLKEAQENKSKLLSRQKKQASKDAQADKSTASADVKGRDPNFDWDKEFSKMDKAIAILRDDSIEPSQSETENNTPKKAAG